MLYRKVNLSSLLGAVGGGTVIVMLLAGLDDFGYPGSATYSIYENFNRIVSVLLVLQGFSLIGLYFWQAKVLGRRDKRLQHIVIIAWAAMVLGTAAEFWLFSDLPYPRSLGDFNLRVAAFTLFLLGSLAVGLALLFLGVRYLRRELPSRSMGMIMLLYLPSFLASFFAGFSIFLAPAVLAILISALVFMSNNRLIKNQVEKQAS